MLSIVNVAIPVTMICVNDHVVVNDKLWRVTKIEYNRSSMLRSIYMESATERWVETYPEWNETRTINRVLIMQAAE